MAASDNPQATQQWAGHVRHQKLLAEQRAAAKARRAEKARRRRAAREGGR